VNDIVDTLNDGVWKAVYDKINHHHSIYELGKYYHKDFANVNLINHVRNILYFSDDVDFDE